MLKTLASICEECERLGLNDDVRILKAWIGANLPHMIEETKLAEELYDLYQAVSTLPPDQIPSRTINLRYISYSTAGKTVRQIMGEIGYILHSLYQHGYLRHDISKLPPKIRDIHIKFGVIIQSLVGLFGLYYNSVDKEQALEEELEDMAELWNTKIVGVLGNFQSAIGVLHVAAREMLNSSKAIRRRFLEEEEDIHSQIENFYRRLDELLVSLRKIFYPIRGKISLIDLELARDLLIVLRDTLVSFSEMNSSLDIEGGKASQKALLFWSSVFSKGGLKERRKSGAQDRADTLDSIKDKPYLARHSYLVETGNKIFEQNKQTLNQKNKAFTAVIRAIIDYNTKVESLIKNQSAIHYKCLQQINHLTKLKETVSKVKKEMPDESKETQAETIWAQQKNIGNKLPFLMMSNVGGEVGKIFDREEDYQGVKVLDYPFETEINEYKKLKELLENTRQSWYNNLWFGEFNHEFFNKVYTASNTIVQTLSEVAENPLNHLHTYESFWPELLTFGSPFDEKGKVSKTFMEYVKQLFTLSYYKNKSGSTEEKAEHLAEMLSTFNSVIHSYLTEKELSIPEEQFDQLRSFVEELNQSAAQEFDKAYEELNSQGEEEPFEQAIFDHATQFLFSIGSFKEWFEESAVEKPSFEKNFKVSSLLSRLIKGQGQVFKIGFTVGKDEDVQSYELQLIIDTKEKKFVTILGKEEGETLRFIERRVHNLPDISTLMSVVLKYVKKQNGELTIPFNDLLEPLTIWYESRLGDIKEEIIEEQEDKPTFEKKTKEPEKKQPGKVSLPGISLTDTGEEKQRIKSRGDTKRLETMHKQIIDMRGSLRSVSNYTGYVSQLKRLEEDLRTKREALYSMAISRYEDLLMFIGHINNYVINSDELLPSFPRILFTSYNRIKTTSTIWKDWRIQHLEKVLHTLNVLLDNLATKDQLERRMKTTQRDKFQTFPRVTIDMIDQKFEDLRKLASS